MSGYEAEEWVEHYTQALTELEHAKVRNRVGEASTAIRARVEKLREFPGLHARGRQAIDDALNALTFLEREEERYDEIQRRKALDTAARKLESIGPKIRKLDEPASK